MKKTLFLSYILAALLACSVVPQAYGYDEEIGDYALTDWWYPDEDFVPNVLNVGEDADDDSDDYWGDVVMDDPIYVWSTNGIITNGSVSCPVYIYSGSKLTLAAAQDGLRAADLVYWSTDDIDLSELDEDEKVMIYMYNNSTLDYRDKDVRLGRLTTYSGDTVYIQCGNLVTEEFGSTWDFTINAKIHLEDSDSHLWIARYTKSVTLKCEQNMNLVVGDDRAYIQDGQYYGVSGDGCKLNECALNLPDNKTSIIYGYLGGTSTITLGNGTILQGRYEAWDNGRGAYISWLTNDIEVRENCSALMTAGYYGGNITMQKGSSLQFYMGLVPAGVDEEHWYGGAGVFMKGGNTLDIGGGAHPFALIVEGEGNTVSHGTLLWNASSTGSASITNGSLTLKNDLTMAENATVSLNGDATLDMGGQTRAFGLTVTGTGNTLKNGAFIGTLTLAENSYLYSDSAMASWDGPTSIVMKNGSRLEMATGTGKDRWINDISALQVEGTATVVNAYLRIKSGETYTLGNGVQNLVGEGRSFLSLDNSTLNLNGGEISKLDIGVWSAFEPYNNVIKDGTLNTYVEIDPSGKLALQNVELGDKASFYLKDNTLLNMGGASIKLSKITLAESATATVDNGMLDLGEVSYTLGIADAAAVIHLDQNHALQLGAGAAVGNGQLCLPGGTNDTPMDYTLNLQGGETSSPAGSGVTLNLGESVTFATNHNTRFLLNEECIGNPDCPVNISVTADGHFILGDSSRDQTVYGDVNLTHTGDGPAATPGAYDVEMNYRLIGNLTAEMKGRSINIGNIGDSQSTEEQNSTATVTEASDATVGSFTGEALKLIAGGAVTFNGAVAATADSVELTGASVSIGGSLAANNDSATVESTGGDISITGTLSTMDTSTLNSAEDITIGGNVTGGALTATAVQSITLQAITIGDKEAALTATNGSITAAAFTGGSLTAKAAKAVTFSGDVASRNNTTLSGASVSIGGSLAASDASANITSTTGDIIIGGTLSSGTSSTLDSAENITVGGNVTGGALTAKAAQSITLQAITIGDNAAVLTAANGSISAGAFTGASLTAEAAGAVTINGGVTASGNAQWQPTVPTDETEYAVVLEGFGVSIDGSLTANGEQPAALYFKSAGAEQAGAYIRSTGGDITITGDLSAKGSSTLDSKGNITLGTLNGKGEITAGGNVTGGDLKAMADDSILMGNIGTSENPEGDVELTAESGTITAGSFTGNTLKANAKGALTFNGDVEASGDDKWQPTGSTDSTMYAVVLEGASVSVNGSLTSSNGKNDIKSTSGDIVIGGDLSAAISSTLDSKGSITLGTLDDNGVITAGGNVTVSTLTATAADSILMGNIGTSENPVGDAVLTAQTGSITAGAFIGGTLTATAADSILLGNIGTSENPVGDAVLTAQTGGIAVGKVNTGKLTATAAGSITMNDVKVSQTGAQIVSTGEGLGENEYANVVLNSFHGAGAQIKASHGSITVEKSVTGAGSEFKNELHARVGVHFKGTADDNNLSNTNIFTPVLNWDSAARLTSVQVCYWDGPGGSPTAPANVTVGGSLYMEHSTMVGNVQITTPTEEEQKVTLNLSSISGQVSGATQLVLNNGGVGNVVVNGSGNLTVTSSGNSDFYCVPRQEGQAASATPVTVTQEIPTLILNGGSLTVSPATSGDSARLLVTELTVKETTTLNSGLRLEDSNDVLTFNVTEKNAVAWGGYAPGEAPDKTLLTVNGQFTQAGGSYGIYASIFLGDQLGNPKENLEKGMWYALMTLEDGKNPDWWDKYMHIESTTDRREGQGLASEDLVWKDGTLYYMSGAELKAATWAPTWESHLWNTTDRNWVQNDMRYRYMDGVTTVFDDTAFNLLADYEGDVYLKGVYTPGSVQVNNSPGNDYTFMDDGAIAGTTTTLTKEGEGSLTIQNANSYSGGTILKQGTLVVANAGALGSGDVTQVGGTLKLSFNGQTSDFGTVTLQGGTVQIAGGAKDFNLVVIGTGARMEGDADNAFTGSLTLEAESHLVSAGSLASWDGPSSITMFNGSMLEMDTKHNIWINDITNLSVVGTATVKNAYLRINPYTNGGKYVLGNGVENLRGEGATAYCLDGSTFDLNDKTTNLNIIVWNEQDIKDNFVEYGTVDTNVDIHAASRLWLYDATIGENATFKMGNNAFLSMGGRSSRTARLNVFTFTGNYATIDDGTLFVEKTEDGLPLVLGTNLSGPDTNVSLRQGTSLDLTGCYLAVNKLSLDTTATSATIGNGMVNSAIVVEAGKTLHLGDPLGISGAVTGGGTLVKDTGGIVNITGSMVNFSGNLVVQGGFFNLLNATSLNNMADVTINKGTLGVYKEETPAEKPATANEGTLTITGGHKLTAGRGTTLNANLVMGGGNKARATLDVHAMAGKGGLQMGSTVTLTPGLVLLSEEDMDGVKALCNADKYDLFYSVDGLSLDGTPNYLAELGSSDSWVKATDVFANDLFKQAEDRYFVFYSGANQEGGAGGNVGTVYIMHVTTLIWNGSAGHMTWGKREDCNWLLGDQSPTYWDYNLDVVFNDTGAGGAVQLEGELEPMSVLVEGTCDYTFTGSGKITGESTKLIKMGSGTLTIENANNYSGDTIIKGGTLALGNDATLGSGTVTLEENGTLKLANGTFANDIQGNGTLVKDNGGTANVTGNMDDFKGSMGNFEGSVVVQSGTLNVMNAPSLDNMADVTINSGTLGVYKGGTTGEANEGTLTITGGHTLTAGMGATLNANLVMEGGATLDVSAMAGLGGLQMGSTVTLTPGLVLLSDEDMDAVGALGFMGKYDLFNSVDGLSLDGTSNFLTELGLADNWVKAADVFANDLFKEAEKEYYVFYSGANQAGGNGGNVGTVYIMQMQIPEPTTGTLSLLALAALAARRRK